MIDDAGCKIQDTGEIKVPPSYPSPANVLGKGFRYLTCVRYDTVFVISKE